MNQPTPETMIAAGALVVVNHSGGKDSQAMMIKLLERVPREQLVVVHASLGDIEWPGALELAQKQAADAGVEFVVATATKSFEQMVERRFATRPSVPSFPSASTRQCTSDLKRNPIDREIRRVAKERGLKLIVSCTGIRAAESAARSKQVEWKRNDTGSKAGREWYSWLPIFRLSTAEVFETIRAAGQQPHPAYASGNERLSCLFCIMASKGDIANAARQHPAVAARFIALEQKTGYTMHMSRKSLQQLIDEGTVELIGDVA